MSDIKKTLSDVCQAVHRKKGEKISVLDVREISSFTDFFLICEGSNRRQNQAICDEIVEALKRDHSVRPLHLEGYDHAEWILIDYVEFVVHIFSKDTRQFYKLEKLWSDGIELEPQALTA